MGGKLVAVQSIVQPRTDPGPNVDVNNPSQQVYSYAANSSGENPGWAGFIVKSGDDEGDTLVQGWYHGFVAEDGPSTARSIKARAFWYYNSFTVTAINSSLYDAPNNNTVTRNGVWMGVGTDLPDAPFHLKAPKNPASNVTHQKWPATNADLKIELTDPLNTGENLSEISFVGYSGVGGTVKELASIAANVTFTTAGSENAALVFSTVTGGTTPAVPVLSVDKNTSILSKLSLVNPGTVAFNVTIAVTSSHVLIDNSGGGGTVTAFTGGVATGEFFVVRVTNSGAGKTVTLANNATIRCGAGFTFAGPQDAAVFMFVSGVGYIMLSSRNN